MTSLLLASDRAFPRIIPFVLFMAFIGVEEALRFITIKGGITISETEFLYIYPIKSFSVGLTLFCFRSSYSELSWKDTRSTKYIIRSILTGILVFILWVNMDRPWATFGTPSGFNPTLVSGNFTFAFLIISRLIGASIVVPVMEELFWRSWLLRYLISCDYAKVSIGTFSWSSFLFGSILFGLEHNFWLSGIIAGALYSILLYSTKNLIHCVIAHAVTNLLLGVYVLQTSKWFFW